LGNLLTNATQKIYGNKTKQNPSSSNMDSEKQFGLQRAKIVQNFTNKQNEANINKQIVFPLRPLRSEGRKTSLEEHNKYVFFNSTNKNGN